VEFVEADGVRIAYARVGKGWPLVFLHGAAEDGRIWQPQLTGLADEFTVVAWDEPGSGQSSNSPEGFGLASLADRLATVIESLELGPAHVAGQSWGGTVALELYRRHPGLVATLILIDTYAGWKGSLSAEEIGTRVAHTQQMLASTGDVDVRLPGLFADDPPAKLEPLLAAIAADVRPGTVAHHVDIMAETDLSDLLPQISVPALLIWGRCDSRSPLSIARQFEEAIPNATLVTIEGAGHMSALERPEPVNRAVREFCRAHPPSRPA
jgi:pimeloyl-ACP methyl ester carboxylesterase